MAKTQTTGDIAQCLVEAISFSPDLNKALIETLHSLIGTGDGRSGSDEPQPALQLRQA